MAEATIEAKFVNGSIPQHVTRMSLASSVGLIGVFIVDLLDMYFLSLLGEAELAAAIGFAGSVTFFTTSVCIGFSIATSVLTARLLGSGNPQQAKLKFMSSVAATVIATIMLASFLMPASSWVLSVLGAEGKTLAFAQSYLHIVIPALPFLGAAMCFGACLRSLGAAKAAMYTTLIGGFVNAILDPILIFVLEMGVEGAALASAISRASMFAYGFYQLYKRDFFCKTFGFGHLKANVSEVGQLAFPALLTNVATPFGNAFIVASIAKFGDSAVAGFAIIGRIIPVAFAVVFALSGAIGPIIGQNYGAGQPRRIIESINFAYFFVTVYTVAVWLLLNLMLDWLVMAFNATGQAEELLRLFCHVVSVTFLFAGITFVGNSVFNNLGKPFYSTAMNWLKATVGTIPFVYIGGHYWQAEGILLGQALGNIVFGIAAIIWVKWFFKQRCEASKD